MPILTKWHRWAVEGSRDVIFHCTGICSVLMQIVAEKFPGAEVVGVDLSPIQPDWCPSNLRFHMDNFEDDWVYGAGFDYVHLRHLAVNIKNPVALLASIYQYAIACLHIGYRILT